ncbi:efflux RND transporter permease subunit [Metabacillus idriensis]|uniref:AcrB/AcrD/AcrF family protein n=1 Tax=Metabacillus idriensis TaxID=324768 RepID=A0A6I2MGM7_9BACI|nr:efflux RND transporter permease subunit [Metabacillus idriensis]MCM3597821.1 efflux RND transporter permease subunit [Metabacillus idriensis]MRX56307.1 AcrB/AcrD/AcrF family protein [Metabacillus idriensis]OHR70638.1 Swarming motility protein SwrC [Bacillus sp. HMSC76G11]
MNQIINFVLKNKFAVWLLTIIVTVAGLYSGLNMKLETIPNITTPIVTVTTVYPGATPEEVAEKVTEPIEQAVQNLNGVNVVSSTSFQNASSIQIEYEFEKDMDKAVEEVKSTVSDLSLPDGVNDSDISRLSINAFPILALSISDDEQSLSDLTALAEDEIVPAIKGLEGVSSVQVSGQQVEEVQFSFKEEKLEEYGLDEETVQNMIKGSDVRFPLGLYTFGDKEQSVIVDGNILTMEDLKNMEIPITPAGGASGQGQSGMAGQTAPESEQNPAGSAETKGQAPGSAQAPAAGQTPPAAQDIELPTVKLSELADIKTVGEAESISRTNGEEAIGLQIVKSADANTVDVANAVKEELDGFEKEYDNLKILSTLDQAEPIEESVSTMLSKALFGAVFAIIIILLFLRDIKSTLISVVSIPLSLLIAVLLLKQMDITLNIMTLGAMTVAIGRVVDDSIVVIENIYRRMSLQGEKLKGMSLVREATKEMFVPIMSSTIVTIAVFLPLALVNGVIGELFLPFALTIVFALLASLVVAVTIVPMLAHSLFKKGLYGETAKKHEEHKPGKMTGAYRSILNWSLNHKWITSGLAVLMLVGSLFLVPVIGVSFLPSEEQKLVYATYKPAPGETKDQVEEVVTKAEKLLMDRKDVSLVQFSLGSENPMSPGDSNSAVFFIEYEDDTENFDKEKEKVIEDLQAETAQGEWAAQDFTQSAGSNEVQFFVYGNQIEDIEPTVGEIEKIMNDNGSFKNVSSSLAESYDEYTLVANQEELSKLGLTAGQIGMELSPQRERPVLTQVEKDGEELNVYLQTEKETYENVEDLTEKTITSPLGKEVKIGDVVTVEEGKTSDTVTRRDGRIYVQVSGELTTDDVAKASAEVQKKVDSLDLPSGVDIDTGGVTEDIQESFTQLGLAMLAAIAIVYLVLVITFGGGLAPFAILFSLPFTVIGALVGLLIAGETISINAMIGALMLIGIVVTNAIVLIDRVIHKEREGLSTRDALLEAGTTRLRPILMTAIATIGALIPLAIGIEGGSGIISKGLGVTVIGGLTSSTLLTLLIVPIVYEMMSKFRRKKTRAVEEE